MNRPAVVSSGKDRFARDIEYRTIIDALQNDKRVAETMLSIEELVVELCDSMTEDPQEHRALFYFVCRTMIGRFESWISDE